nr:MAG TPA: hypothetical protein [Caudoviricetes sp.]
MGRPPSQGSPRGISPSSYPNPLLPKPLPLYPWAYRNPNPYPSRTYQLCTHPSHLP